MAADHSWISCGCSELVRAWRVLIIGSKAHDKVLIFAGITTHANFACYVLGLLIVRFVHRAQLFP